MAEVRLEAVDKIFSNGVHAVRDLSLDIADGEFLVLMGPSGCGKSSVLRMIAGLERVSSGNVFIGDRLANDLEPRERDLAMVFQNYALYPQLSVKENIGFPLRLRKVPKTEVEDQVDDAAALLDLIDQLHKSPGKLSGGERQRVATGRAIVRRPAAFLMDEPLSNLDAQQRSQMRNEIAAIHRDLAITTVYVTNDQTEAMSLGDRVAVLDEGVLQQVDHPQALYARPRNVFIATAIGTPTINLTEGMVSRDGDDYRVTLGNQSLSVPAAVVDSRPGLAEYLDVPVVVGIRPEDLEDAEVNSSHPTEQRLWAIAGVREALGAETFIHFSITSPPVEIDGELVPGDSEPETTRCTARFSPRTRAQVGDAIDVTVDVQNLFFFDTETHDAIG